MDTQLRQREVPVLHRVSPFLGGLQHTGVEQFQQGILVGKAPLGLGQFAELAVDSLDSIGRVDRFSDVLWVFKVRRQVLPFAAPRLDYQWIFLAPLRFQIVQQHIALLASR